MPRPSPTPSHQQQRDRAKNIRRFFRLKGRKPPWKWKWKWCLFTKHQRSSEDDERTSGPSAQVNYQVSPEEHEFFKGFRYAKKGKRDFEGRPVEEESEELREALRKSLAKDYTCLNLCCCCLVEKIVERRVEDKIDKKDDKFGLGSERRSRQSKMLADSSDTTILTDAGRGKMETTTSPSTDGEGEGAGNKRVENMSSPRSSGINIPSRIESGSFSSALDKVYREAAQSPTSSEKEGAARRALLTENSKVTVGPGSGSGPQQPVSPAAGSPVSGGAAGSPTGMPMASNPPAGSTSTDESLLLRPGLERGWGSARWRRGRKRRQDRQYMEGADLVTETGEDDTTEGTATEERKKGGKGKRHPKAEDDNHHVERLSDDSALFKLKHLTYNDDVDLRGLRSSGPLDHHRQSSVTGALLTQKEVSELFVQLADSANSALVIMEDFGGSFVKKIYKSTVAKMRERTVRFYYPWFVTRAEVPKQLNENVTDDALNTKSPRQVLFEIPFLLRRMQLSTKLVSDDFESEHVVGGLDLNARFADVYYALCEFMTDMDAALLRLGFQLQEPKMRLDDFMPKEVQTPKSLKIRMERDWIIYRDTRNALQYWIDCFWFYSSTRGGSALAVAFGSVAGRRRKVRAADMPILSST